MKAIILAAGKGSRMQSDLPKPLLPVAGKPMLSHVLDAVREFDESSYTQACVVVGHQGQRMRESYAGQPLQWVEQSPQLGTGHAVQCAMSAMASAKEEENVVILYGDVPLLTSATLKKMQFEHILQDNALTVLSTELDVPTGYGRLVRDEQGGLSGIVEEKDATEAQRAICEVNTGIMMAKLGDLRTWLSRLDNDNAQAEYYLTDIVAMAVNDGKMIGVTQCTDPNEVAGANTPEQLAELEAMYFARCPS